MMRTKEEHIVRRMLDVDLAGKRSRGCKKLGWKDACQRYMSELGLKEDNIPRSLGNWPQNTAFRSYFSI